MNEILICKCSDVKHQIVLSMNEEYCYASIHLVPLPFWKRIKHAIKYIFKKSCNYGDFEEFIFDKKDIPKIEKLITHLKMEK